MFSRCDVPHNRGSNLGLMQHESGEYPTDRESASPGATRPLPYRLESDSWRREPSAPRDARVNLESLPRIESGRVSENECR